MTQALDAKTLAAMRSGAALYLNSTCTIERTTPAQNSTGEVENTWTTVATVACGLISKRQQLVSPDKGEHYETVYQVVLPYGADIQKGDRLVDFTGMLSLDGPIHISSVLPATAAFPVYTFLETDYIPGS